VPGSVLGARNDEPRASALREQTHANFLESLLTIRAASRTLLCEVELTARIFNSECLQIARLSYGAAAPRVAGSVSRSMTQPWINRHRGALDSSKEGKEP